MNLQDERGDRSLTQEEIALKVLERRRAELEQKEREAAFDLLDEKLLLAFRGGAAFGIGGLVVMLVGFLVFRDVMIGMAGTGVGLVGFGVISAAQYLKIRSGGVE